MLTTPTQVLHPWRTTLRTIVWLVIALAPTVPTLWAIVVDEVTKAGLTLPPAFAASVGIGIAVIVAVVGIVQRVVLIPAVAAIIATIPGLNPSPAIPAPAVIALVPAASVTANADGSVTSVPADGTPPTTTLS
jgi:hypothetical protein